MKTPRRTITLVLALAVASCALILTLRVFAQTTTSRGTTCRLNITGEPAKLKSDYINSNFAQFDALLNAKSKDFDMVDEKGNHHKPSGSHSSIRPSSVTTSEIIKVSTSASPSATIKTISTGANVTQSVTTTNTSDMTDILAAFQ